MKNILSCKKHIMLLLFLLARNIARNIASKLLCLPFANISAISPRNDLPFQCQNFCNFFNVRNIFSTFLWKYFHFKNNIYLILVINVAPTLMHLLFANIVEILTKIVLHFSTNSSVILAFFCKYFHCKNNI